MPGLNTGSANRSPSHTIGARRTRGGGKRCAIVTAFAVAQHAAQAFARFVDARGGESGLQRCGVFRTLLVKQKDAALPPGNSPTPEWRRMELSTAYLHWLPFSIIASADHAPLQ